MRIAWATALLAATLLAAIGALAQAPAERPWQVVILDGGDAGSPAAAAVERAMRAALGATAAHGVEFHQESLDAARFPGTDVEAEQLALFARRYGDRRIDAVIAVAPAALDFAEKHRDRLWPSARIVYHSVPEEFMPKRALRPVTTGVPLRYELAGTVALALQLRPEAKRVVVIAGAAEADRQMTDRARTSLAPFGGRVEVEYWTDRKLDELRAQVAKLPSDAIVLYLGVHRDAAGRTLAPNEALRELAAASPAPFFGVVETQIGAGIVAGRVDSLELRGQRAAALVAAALSAPVDARAAQLPIAGTAKCVADDRALVRHGLDEDRLPQGCEVRYRTPSLWRDVRGYVAAAVAVLAGLCVLAFLRYRRRRTEAARRGTPMGG
jgi:hypothetical protein